MGKSLKRLEFYNLFLAIVTVSVSKNPSEALEKCCEASMLCSAIAKLHVSLGDM